MWDNRLRSDIGNRCKISIDGTDFRTCNWKPFWRGWYTYKHKCAGLRYEIGVGIQGGDIVWINGPFPPGAFPDISIFRKALKEVLLEHNEMAEGDRGYRGEPQLVRTPVDGSVMQMRVRSRHETVNKRFKQWGALQKKFYHRLCKHQIVFCAVAVIIQLTIENGEPLFGVTYDENVL